MLAVEFSTLDYVLAALAAFAAGIVNALAGGGTLISFPALMALGATNVDANITNTVALCPGYLGGAYAQRGSLADNRTRLRLLCVAAGLGGLTGSILLVTTDEKLFTELVPWLILLACALLGGQNHIKRCCASACPPTARHPRSPVVAAAGDLRRVDLRRLLRRRARDHDARRTGPAVQRIDQPAECPEAGAVARGQRHRRAVLRVDRQGLLGPGDRDGPGEHARWLVRRSPGRRGQWPALRRVVVTYGTVLGLYYLLR